MHYTNKNYNKAMALNRTATIGMFELTSVAPARLDELVELVVVLFSSVEVELEIIDSGA
jgi:hypothetical protein